MKAIYSRGCIPMNCILTSKLGENCPDRNQGQFYFNDRDGILPEIKIVIVATP